MLTVIIDARDDAERLPALLAQLTAGAVDGLVRQVVIVAAAGQAGNDDLFEETGAEAYSAFEAAATAASIVPYAVTNMTGVSGLMVCTACSKSKPDMFAIL